MFHCSSSIFHLSSNAELLFFRLPLIVFNESTKKQPEYKITILIKLT